MSVTPLQPAVPAPEFSRLVIADKVPRNGMHETLAANADECAALAGRFGLLAIRELKAVARLKRIKRDYIRVTGEFEASVIQYSVVSLEPVPARVSEPFSAMFAPDHLLPKMTDDPEGFDLASVLDEDSDLPEAMPGGRIDLGELVAQHLSLALDPYPRLPGESFNDILEDPGEGIDLASLPPEELEPEPEGEGTKNPFAILAGLKLPQ